MSSARWAAVEGAYRAVGLTPRLDLDSLPPALGGCVYAGGVAALGSDFGMDAPGLALHDLAHFLVAPAGRRYAPNFGLGPHPSLVDVVRVRASVRGSARDEEETAASHVNVLVADLVLGAQLGAECAYDLGMSVADVDALRCNPSLFIWSATRGRGAASLRRLARRGMIAPGGAFVPPTALAAFVDRARGGAATPLTPGSPRLIRPQRTSGPSSGRREKTPCNDSPASR